MFPEREGMRQTTSTHLEHFTEKRLSLSIAQGGGGLCRLAGLGLPRPVVQAQDSMLMWMGLSQPALESPHLNFWSN